MYMHESMYMHACIHNITSFSVAGIKYVILLTHIDNVCADTHGDVTKAFYSKTVEGCARQAALLLDTGVDFVLPIHNYSQHSQVTLNKNILSKWYFLQIR